MLWIYKVDLHIQVLAVSCLDTAQCGSLESMGAKGYLQVARSLLESSACICISFQELKPNKLDISI